MNRVQKVELGIDGWRQDLLAKSLSWYPVDTPVEVSSNLIDYLEIRAREAGLNSRVCLHTSQNADFHEMIICKIRGREHAPKRHLKKDKTFTVLRGRLLISVLDESGSEKKSWVLEPSAKKGLFSIRVPAGMFHVDLPLSDTSVHIETTLGPFDGKLDTEYIWDENNITWLQLKSKLIRKHF
jgi:cupin fold WbuC family metalloprotein